MTQTLHETVQLLALQLYDHSGYVGNRYVDSGTIARMIEKAVNQHLHQWDVQPATQNERNTMKFIHRPKSEVNAEALLRDVTADVQQTPKHESTFGTALARPLRAQSTPKKAPLTPAFYPEER
jgi:hypothetical protein